MEAKSSAFSEISQIKEGCNKKEYWLFSKINYILQEEFKFGERDSKQNRLIDFARLEGFMKKASKFPIFCSFVHWDYIIFLNEGTYYKKQANKFFQKKFLRFNSLVIAYSNLPSQKCLRQCLPGKLCDLARNISLITEKVVLEGLVIHEKEFRSLLIASCNLKEFRFEFCTILNKNKRISENPKTKVKTILFYKTKVLNLLNNHTENPTGVNISSQSSISYSAEPLLGNLKNFRQVLNTIKSCVDASFLKKIEFKRCNVNPIHLEQWKGAHPELRTVNVTTS
ncbi:unnamed protein product [Moneuplotes crassus]|uniref:Uncharacterized protein n=1 Tax=Euplotes crassus TaxID=5936 RepID=A0AAD1XRH8_EUPCR|nr:unnamed protein product [Moneuplotes crassus]